MEYPTCRDSAAMTPGAEAATSVHARAAELSEFFGVGVMGLSSVGLRGGTLTLIGRDSDRLMAGVSKAAGAAALAQSRASVSLMVS